jgi:hypothetical protein
MDMAKRERTFRRAARGTALAESIMVIPLLAIVLGLTFFFGWVMRNQQGVREAARYAAWRRVIRGSSADAGDLDRMFLRNAAAPVEVSGARVGEPTLLDYADGVSRFSRAAGDLADATAVDRFPRGYSAHVAAEFPTDVGLWQRFTGPIRARHSREGVEWRRGQASVEQAIRDLHLAGIDQALDGVPSPGNQLAERLRDLYRGPW